VSHVHLLDHISAVRYSSTAVPSPGAILEGSSAAGQPRPPVNYASTFRLVPRTKLGRVGTHSDVGVP
jgi:hypothetical protein